MNQNTIALTDGVIKLIRNRVASSNGFQLVRTKGSFSFKNKIRRFSLTRIWKDVNLVAVNDGLSCRVEEIAIIVTSFTAHGIDTWLILNRMENAHSSNSFHLPGIVGSLQHDVSKAATKNQ